MINNRDARINNWEQQKGTCSNCVNQSVSSRSGMICNLTKYRTSPTHTCQHFSLEEKTSIEPEVTVDVEDVFAPPKKSQNLRQFWTGLAITIGAIIWTVASLEGDNSPAAKPVIFLVIGLFTMLTGVEKFVRSRNQSGEDENSKY